MKNVGLVCLAASLLTLAPAPSRAGVNVERTGSENPVQEVAKSTLYGALAGLVVGGAIALAAQDDSGESVRWGIVGGTFVGLGLGIYFVSHRPQPTALLELDRGGVGLAPPGVSLSPTGGANVHLVALRF